MVAQRTLSSGEFQIMVPPFDLHDGAINPIEAVGGLMIPKSRVLLPEHTGVESFRVALDPSLPDQIDSRHQVYFGNLYVDGQGPEGLALKTYNTNNGANNWRKEVAAHELARRAGLPTLSPVLLAQTRSGATLMGTRYISDLFDLDRRFMGSVPVGYEIDELALFLTSAAALATLHNSDVIHGDAAPRNFAFRGISSGDRKPVVIDPETYRFPGEQKASEIKDLKERDLNQLINESASLVAIKEAREKAGGKNKVTKVKVPESAILEAQKTVADAINPIYHNITGHSF
jgi:hypothetical protein